MQYQQSLGMANNIFRRQTRPKKKTMANLDNVRRTIYICDIASKAIHLLKPHAMLCILPACEPSELVKDICHLARPRSWQSPMTFVLQVTEAEVAQHFADCGQIMDCRVCGDPNSAMRFAFIEFRDEASLMQVLPSTLL